MKLLQTTNFALTLALAATSITIANATDNLNIDANALITPTRNPITCNTPPAIVRATSHQIPMIDKPSPLPLADLLSQYDSNHHDKIALSLNSLQNIVLNSSASFFTNDDTSHVQRRLESLFDELADDACDMMSEISEISYISEYDEQGNDTAFHSLLNEYSNRQGLEMYVSHFDKDDSSILFSDTEE